MKVYLCQDIVKFVPGGAVVQLLLISIYFYFGIKVILFRSLAFQLKYKNLFFVKLNFFSWRERRLFLLDITMK